MPMCDASGLGSRFRCNSYNLHDPCIRAILTSASGLQEGNPMYSTGNAPLGFRVNLENSRICGRSNGLKEIFGVDWQTKLGLS